MGKNRQQDKKPNTSSLGTEGTNTFHQRNPNTDLAKCTTDALVIQLQDTFKEIRNETFERFQFL